MTTSNPQKYDEFLLRSKPKLKQRLQEHLQFREKFLKKAVQNTVIHLKQLGYAPFMNQPTQYNASFINKEAIDDLIDSWSGPNISKPYKPMNATKFTKNSVNWLDQRSWKVTQKFFANHIEEIISYLNDCCQPLHTDYARVYFAVELLSTKITGFDRCRQQPLIRYRTLKEKCKELHEAFKLLHPELDLVHLKSLAKKKKKQNPENNTPNKQRIQSKSFAEDLLTHCSSILAKERMKLAVNPCADSNHINIETMDRLDAIDMDDTYHKNIKRSKKRAIPPPLPPKPTKKRKTAHTCCCETVHPATNHQGFVGVPVIVPVPYGHQDPMAYIATYYPFMPFRYQRERGGAYNGSSADFRAHPYEYHGSPPQGMDPHPVMSHFAPALRRESFANEAIVPQPPLPFSDWLPTSNPMMERNGDRFSVDNRSSGEDTASSLTSVSFTPPNDNGSYHHMHMPRIGNPNFANAVDYNDRTQITMDDYLPNSEYETDTHRNLAAMQNREDNVNAIDNIL